MGRNFLRPEDMNKLVEGGSYIQKPPGGEHFQTSGQKSLGHLGRPHNQCVSLRRKIHIDNPPVFTCARPYDKALFFETVQHAHYCRRMQVHLMGQFRYLNGRGFGDHLDSPELRTGNARLFLRLLRLLVNDLVNPSQIIEDVSNSHLFFSHVILLAGKSRIVSILIVTIQIIFMKNN
jgi:hypothetical protein